MTIANNILRSEHCEMECILTGLSRLARDIEPSFHRVDRRLLWLLLDWIESFPITFHHPKEEELLFPAVISRCPEAVGLVDHLIEEHAKGIELMIEMRSVLEAEPDSRFRGQAFRDAAMRYVSLEEAHIKVEEKRLFPIAQRVLSKDDWAGINRVFLNDSNPLLTSRRREQFNGLFVKILRGLSDGIAA